MLLFIPTLYYLCPEAWEIASSVRTQHRDVLETTAKFLKRIAKKIIQASRGGTREARSFRKLMTAKLSVVLMRGNIKLLDIVRQELQSSGV